jgi:hypothetical protein
MCSRAREKSRASSRLPEPSSSYPIWSAMCSFPQAYICSTIGSSDLYRSVSVYSTLGGHLRVHLPGYEPVAFQFTQLPRQHPLGDVRSVSRELFLDLPEPERPVPRGPEDRRFPPAAENVYGRFDRTMVVFPSRGHNSPVVYQYTGWEYIPFCILFALNIFGVYWVWQRNIAHTLPDEA